MTNTAPVNPATFDGRLASMKAQIDRLQDERSGYLAKLALEPDSAQLDALLVTVEGEIDTLSKTRGRLLDARTEAALRFTAEAHVAFVEQLKADASEVQRIGLDMAELAQDLYAQIGKLRPQLERYVTLSDERANLAWGILRAGGPRRGNAGSQWHSQASLREGPFALLLEAAFRAAGIGSLAPTKGITVPPAPTFAGRDGRYIFSGGRGVPAPGGTDQRTCWHGDAANHVALARQEFDKGNEKLTLVLQREIAAVKAQAK